MKKFSVFFALLLMVGIAHGTGSPMVRFFTQAHGDTIGEMRIDGVMKAWVSVWGNWHRANGDSAYYGQGGGGAAWGEITGTLSNQSDLNTALLAKEATANKGAANGYPSLDANSKVPTLYLGGSGADNTKYLRGDQTWTTFPTIPSAWDSASVAANSWKLGTLDSTTFKAHVLAGTAAGANLIQGKDTTYLFRTARSIKLIVDSSRVISAKRTAIGLTGVLATDRAWVSWADSVSGSRKRGLSGVCKANSLCVFSDTTAGTVNYQILR